MNKLLICLLLVIPTGAFATGGELALDRAPIDPDDAISIQRGAQVFVNYCLGCHSAQYMRYNRLAELGLTESQIAANLIFTGQKVGETMNTAMPRAEAKEWFGAAPPDLSVVARARGADWLYTYLRTFYRDDGRPSGWNNLAFPNVGMPHVLWQLQGQQVLKVESRKDAHGQEQHLRTLALASPGQLPPAEYDKLAADLVNYLVYVGEPVRAVRTQIGVAVLLVLGVLFVLVYLLKKEYWKDIH